MRLTRADIAALLIALGAAVTGVVVWNHGTVDLGMTLRVADAETEFPDSGLTDDVVVVDDVTPGGNADRNGFTPGLLIVELTTTDGSEVERGEPIEGIEAGTFTDGQYWETGEIGGGTLRLPVEAIDSTRIATAFGGWVYPADGFAEIFASIDRPLLEYELNQSLWIAALALLLGAAVWRLLAHGLAGPFGRRHALVVGVAVAVPGLIYPAVQVGTPAGIAGAALVPAAVALVLGLSISRHHPDPQWANTARAAAVVAAGMAAVIVLRALTNPALSSNDAGTTLLMIAAIGVVPAAIAGLGTRRSARERASLLSLGLVPAAAAILNAQRYAEPILPLVLVALLLGWYVLPIERAVSLVGGGLARVRSTAPTPPATGAAPAPAAAVHEPIVSAAFRDKLTLALLGATTVLTILRPDIGSFSVIGAVLGGAVWLVIRNGFLGPHWVDAAVPLAAAVGVPVMLASWWGWSDNGTAGWYVITIALVGLSVAHVLAGRHSHAEWRQRLLIWAGVLAGGAVFIWLVQGGYDSSLALVAASAVPLVPGLPVAFADDPDEPRAISTRLETLVVALTLGISAMVLTPLAWVPLVAWLIAVVVWRRFTLAPLVGLAQRTQLQRDLAVAAAETERARLAADLHDDALQQLTMLVRTLDEGGHTAEADEAREVATKLRSVVGDLRLPILDDLGAGAALEWLVERVEPLAGGPVKLERSDESRPPANVELAVFRVAQEALTNAIKHGKPPIAVHYDVRADGRVTLAIDDAGPGIGPDEAEEAPRAGHFGLANMQQRAEQIGALLDVRRWPAGGTRVALEWRPQA